MSALEDRPNPLGHIRFPHAFNPSNLVRTVEETAKVQSKLVEQMATYRLPQIDWAGLDRATKQYEELVQHSLDYTTRFSAMLDASRKSWEQTQKTIQSVITSNNFLETFAQSQRMAERMAETLLRLPTILPDFTVLQDRVIVRDLILPPAGECRDYGPVLPLEEIIQEDITFDPVEFEEAAQEASERPASLEEAEPTLDTVRAPLFLHSLDLDLQEKIFQILPPEADLIDDTIALYEPRKAGIYILTQYGWVKEEEGVSTQTICIIQYLRRIGKRPEQPCASLTEIAEAVAKRAVSIRTARSSASNRIARIEEICMERNLKPILIRSAGLWRINTELTHWDAIPVKPWVHI